mmetsp:Transcript_47206/g.110381  ORF Transcript_47206/g.110381 Transcript_47206/m.110381 type:complete len:80 (-) Transcript_47206:261-500(-)
MHGRTLFAKPALPLLLSQGVWALGENPACWVNWQVNITEDGVTRTGDACEEYSLVTILNMIVFFGIFVLIVKSMVQQTQ